MRRLVALNAVLLALVVLHDLDHVRQGRALNQELFGVGALALVTAVVALLLAARRHRLGAPAAIVVGTGNVVGLVAVHVLPHWSALSDPYPAAHVDALSWCVLAAMMITAAALAGSGLTAMRPVAARRPEGASLGAR